MKKGNITQLEHQIKVYNLKINQNPDDSESYYLKALTLIKLMRKEEALDCLEKAISINSDEIAYRAYQAQLYFEIGNYEITKKILRDISVLPLSTIENARNNKAKNIIIELRKEMQNLESNLTEKEKSQNLEHRIENLEEKKQQLEHRIESLEKDNQEIKQDVCLLQDMIESFVVERVNSSTEYESSDSLIHQKSTDSLLGATI